MGTVRYSVLDGEIIAEKRNGVRSLYVPDPLGSTVALLDNTQTKTDTFSYWPYGEDTHLTGTTPTPFRYVGTKGYYRDSATKTYVRARYLVTSTSRWLTEDPISFKGGDWNLYRYVKNNPMSWVDPSGLQLTVKSTPFCVACFIVAIFGAFYVSFSCWSDTQHRPGTKPYEDCVATMIKFLQGKCGEESKDRKCPGVIEACKEACEIERLADPRNVLLDK
jgi:RHS repeat-associated protein